MRIQVSAVLLVVFFMSDIHAAEAKKSNEYYTEAQFKDYVSDQFNVIEVNDPRISLLQEGLYQKRNIMTTIAVPSALIAVAGIAEGGLGRLAGVLFGLIGWASTALAYDAHNNARTLDSSKDIEEITKIGRNHIKDCLIKVNCVCPSTEMPLKAEQVMLKDHCFDTNNRWNDVMHEEILFKTLVSGRYGKSTLYYDSEVK